MYSLDDTIAAISTPIGQGGIGIVKISGPEALAILQEIFVPSEKAPRSTEPWQPVSHHLHHGHIVDPESREVVDEVLASCMKAPLTYTRQDVVEINCHGGIVALRRVLELALRHGARLAGPGEMTLRAFLLGRIDLAQAEAVLDVVRAKTEAGLRAAAEQLDGHLSREIREVRAQLLDVLAYLEATIDFTEDEIPERDVHGPLQLAASRLNALLDAAAQGMIYRQGIRAAIVGRPNVGKSSLLNSLLRTSRAIVTPIPGTTRDTLEETINLEGIPLTLVDTAGISESDDLIEQLGVERSRQALTRADLALLVVDVSEPLQDSDLQILSLIAKKPAILVLNKIDLPAVAAVDDLLLGVTRARISALTEEGLPDLEKAIVQVVFSGQVMASDTPLVSNPRHKAALQRALQHVEAAQEAQEQAMPADFVAIDLTAAVNVLGEITGETATDDLLQIIFSEFCVGK
jgi:tRNA modification GTPase